MKNYIIEFNITAECPVNVASVVSQWNNRCSIKQWKEEYTLMEDHWVAGKRKGCSKIKISLQDAFKLIKILNLREQKSEFLRSGSFWRTCSTEKQMVMVEIESYFFINPSKKPNKFVQNVINELKIPIVKPSISAQ